MTATFGRVPDPTLEDLDEDARNAAFEKVQARLPEVWKRMRLNEPDESVVVVPSVTPDPTAAQPGGALIQAMEERFLFLLLLLRQPRLRMVYVTSMPINPSIIEYYLALLPGVIPSHARARLSLVAVGDSSWRSLTAKLLARPRLLSHITSLVPDPNRSHLVPYNTTGLERDLSIALGIPMYGADPRLFPLGTKTGCRRMFAEAGVNYPAGFEDLRSVGDVVQALSGLRSQSPAAGDAMVKLNEGVSGRGNAVVDLRNLPAPGDPREPTELEHRVRHMALEDESSTNDAFLARLLERGGIAEERIVGDEMRSPSVQLRITPFGEIELLSTHDQLLGGPSGQSYLGCVFPADPAYARTITQDARLVGEVLRTKGVLGRFAIDFVVVRRGPAWTSYAIEVNLRKGGTTHPFLTLQFLTDGRYDPDTALFTTPTGRERHLIATDHLEDPSLRGLRVDDLFDLVARHGLHFDQARQAGIVFHMISCLTELGRVGMTAVGESPRAAQVIYDRAERILLREARSSIVPRPLARINRS